MDWSIWRNRKPLKFSLGGKVGCWVQRSSVDSPLVFNSKISWFVCDDKILSQVIAKANDRKIVLGFGGSTNSKLFIDQIVRRRQHISAAVWDYEIKATPEQAIIQLGEVFNACQSLKLPFGVAVLANPRNSFKTNGVPYEKADQLCDFLMPMLYSQVWNHDFQITRNIYLSELNASSVPLIPIIARETVRETIHEALLTPDLLNLNYKPLMLKNVVVWNAASADQNFWDQTKKL
jgi:hypothetical protein